MIMISKILIVGLGSIGKLHLKIARELFPDAEILVFRHLKSLDIPEFSNGCIYSIEEIISFDPEIGIICNPSSLHVSIAKAMAELKTNLLIEKPISSSLEGVQELIQLFNENDKVLFVGYNLRFSYSLNHFRKLLEYHEIGNILSVRCEVGQSLINWRPDKDYREGVSAIRKLGGGVLLELSHEIDYLQWIFGDIDWVRATLSQQSSLDIDVEDTAFLTLGFTSESRKKKLIGTLHMDFIRQDTTRLCTAIGELGSLQWNGITGEVKIYTNETQEWKLSYVHPPVREDTYRDEWKYFIECITGKVKNMDSALDALNVLRVIEAANASSSTGVQVNVQRP